MRLYYVDDLICNDEELTISLAFPFEAELVLKFPGGQMFVWGSRADGLGDIGCRPITQVGRRFGGCRMPTVHIQQ